MKNVSNVDELLSDRTRLQPGAQKTVVVYNFELEWLKRGKAIEVGAPLDKWTDPRYLESDDAITIGGLRLVDEAGNPVTDKVVTVKYDPINDELADIEVTNP